MAGKDLSKVLQINDVASVGTNLVAGLQSLGVDASLCNLTHGNKNKLNPFLWYMAAPFVQLQEALQVRKMVIAGNYDFVHIHYGSHAWILFFINRPSFLHFHGSDIRRDYHWPVFKTIMDLGCRRAAKVIYATPDIAEDVKRIRADAIFLPDPIDTDVFVPAVEENKRDEVTILCVSKMDRTKGMHILFPAIEQIWQRCPRAKVVLFGFGNNLDAAKGFFAKHAGNPNLVISPRVSRQEMINRMQSTSVIIGQLELGALGCSELEAMACGKPVVARFTYPQFYPEPPPVCSSSTPEEVCDQVIQLLDDDQLRKKVGLESRKWVMAYHDKKVVARKMLEIYQDVS